MSNFHMLQVSLYASESSFLRISTTCIINVFIKLDKCLNFVFKMYLLNLIELNANKS
ncbi:hypothetical protein IQ02_02533 [Flavobacterium glaciei]|uniref:Uncharacterized protein n=1 Tax=Flavobacterium glaciei TaxID=386300 RepID=A0A562PKA1_9FLAO|nr:hypothetical protein DFR66_11720 [Flavobacterium glaciei]TWI44640.1 hypothetical protein IQ02_02533 [Flavobacterium glaciei]